MLFTTASSPEPMNSAILAAISGLIVGGVIRIVEKFLSKGKDELEEHIALRKELREELDSVKEEIYKLQTQVDEWRQKYYDQVNLTNELTMKVHWLTDELDEYKRISGIHPSADKHNGWFEVPPEKE